MEEEEGEEGKEKAESRMERADALPARRQRESEQLPPWVGRREAQARNLIIKESLAGLPVGMEGSNM